MRVERAIHCTARGKVAIHAGASSRPIALIIARDSSIARPMPLLSWPRSMEV